MMGEKESARSHSQYRASYFVIELSLVGHAWCVLMPYKDVFIFWNNLNGSWRFARETLRHLGGSGFRIYVEFLPRTVLQQFNHMRLTRG